MRTILLLAAGLFGFSFVSCAQQKDKSTINVQPEGLIVFKTGEEYGKANGFSQDMTLAISKSLNISVEEAESLKRERGVSPAAKPGMPGAAPTAAESASLAAVTPEQLAQIMLPTLNYIFSEANRVLFNYQKKYNKNVAKVVLTGGGAALKGFADIAKKEMQTAVESANPFAKTDAPAFLQQLLAQSGPEFSVSIGLALRRLQELK
jgi:cell division protein FtsA